MSQPQTGLLKAAGPQLDKQEWTFRPGVYCWHLSSLAGQSIKRSSVRSIRIHRYTNLPSVSRSLFLLFLLLALVSVPAYGNVLSGQARAGEPGRRPSECKTAPSDARWPSEAVWARFNESVGGRLLRPTPPGAVCHPRQVAYDAGRCAAVAAGWFSYDFHQDDPVSNMWQQFNNDTCLPNPGAPCSPDGYPAAVVNATSARDVQLGLQFARAHNIRVVVKSTGHDYQGRSQAPGALSIWVHHLRGLRTHTSFRPQGCNLTIDSPAVTAGGGSQMMDLYSELDKINRTIVGGNSKSVSVGGYISGGGHSVLSPRYGLGADQVLEMEVVTPMGDIVVLNECQNQDLFWAVRGGGGSTFGVMTSVTLATHPSPQIVGFDIGVYTLDLNATYIWDMVGYLLSQFPYLTSEGVSGYSYISGNLVQPDGSGGTVTGAGMAAIFLVQDTQDVNDALSILAPVFDHIDRTWPDVAHVVAAHPYRSLLDWFDAHYDRALAGSDVWAGSHLLDAAAFDRNSATALGEAFGAFGGAVFLVAGRGVWEARPRGGGNAVHPSWRRALGHALASAVFPPLDGGARRDALADVNARTELLRRLAPDMGAYVNENNPGEPDWQLAFWGDNYDRLLQIKREVDPLDILWCHPCVGNERWREDGYRLCRVDDFGVSR